MQALQVAAGPYPAKALLQVSAAEIVRMRLEVKVVHWDIRYSCHHTFAWEAQGPALGSLSLPFDVACQRLFASVLQALYYLILTRKECGPSSQPARL